MLRAARASIADLVRGDPSLHYGSHLVRYARPGAGAGCRRAWQLGAAVLEPVYGAAVGADRRAGSAVRLPSPVISVGNAVWGGTGKTPMVEYVARLLQQPASAPGGGGGRAVVLTRGVGGDEDGQLRARLPSAVVAVGADRAAAARRALTDMGGAGAVAAFILDDGLQVRQRRAQRQGGEANAPAYTYLSSRSPSSAAALGLGARPGAADAQRRQRHGGLALRQRETHPARDFARGACAVARRDPAPPPPPPPACRALGGTRTHTAPRFCWRLPR